MSVRYGVSDLAEARAYLAHPVLGARLRECVAIMMAQPGCSASDILGEVDALKFRSCLTLFARAAGEGSEFDATLRRYFGGVACAASTAMLRRADEAASRKLA